MSDTRTASDRNVIQFDSAQMLRGLGHPSTLLLLAANALPIVGVLFWHWDVFVLLALYWMETAVIGFWMIVRIAIAPPGSLGNVEVNGRPVAAGSLFMAAFFVVHAGMFMGVHMVFLWSLFSGAWSRIVHGPADFFRILVIGTGLWVPLLVLFIVRGASFLFHVLKPESIERIERSLNLPVSSVPPADDVNTIISAFYGRVIIMHMTIIFSAFLSLIFGSITPLIIMVVLKTIADVGLHLAFDFGKLQKISQTALTAKST
ncbi:MAG TPA: DUF6498-containing protein [Xanthobacteraceae bacterium]|nr:DUF6498-containing protein [Xanthobacteraceae bacterium]